MSSEDLIELYNKLDRIDHKLVGFHNALLIYGMKETTTEYHVREALAHVLHAIKDLERRIEFTKQNEKERRNETAGGDFR